MLQVNENKCETALLEIGVKFNFIKLPKSVHSVKDVQMACNCHASEVIKTLLVIIDNDIPIMVILPGNKRANFEKIKTVMGGSIIRMATPQEVLDLTGYKVGTVSPFGVDSGIRKLADKLTLELENLFLGTGQNNIILKLPQASFPPAFQGSFYSICD